MCRKNFDFLLRSPTMKASVMDPPPVELQNRLQDGISTGTEATAVELGFSLCVWSFWGMWIHIGRRRAPGATRASLEAGGAPWEGGCAPTLEGSPSVP